MDGAHLGGQNGVALTEHLFGKLGAVVGHVPGGGESAPLLPLPHGGKQAPDADAHRAQIVYLVDLQAGIDLAATL